MKEKNENDNKPKINFFKKVWYSIANLKKYSELKQKSPKKSTEYLTTLVVIMAILISIIPTYKSYKFISNGVEYIQDELPNFKYESGILNVESDEAIKLQNDFIKYLSNGYNLLIDTKIENEEIIQYYLENLEGEKKAILLKDKIITIEGEERKEYQYQGAINSFLRNERTEFNKQDVINYFSTPFYRYYINNCVTFFVSLFITFIIMGTIVTVIIFLYVKVVKKNLKIKEIYSIVCHASTLPIILYTLYMVLNYMLGLQIKFVDEIYIIITLVYSILAIKSINNK